MAIRFNSRAHPHELVLLSDVLTSPIETEQSMNPDPQTMRAELCHLSEKVFREAPEKRDLNEPAV